MTKTKVSKYFLNNLILIISLCSVVTVGCSKTTSIKMIAPALFGGGDSGNGGVSAGSVNQNKIAMGAAKGFAITSTGIAKAWGANYEFSNGVAGQLGLGLVGNVNVNSPQTLDSGVSYISFASGEIGSCGLTNSKKVKCWGSYPGDGSGTERNVPVLINDGGIANYIDVTFGSYHGCAVQEFGILKCWGDGWDGKLGTGDASGAQEDSPVTADPGTNYIRVSAGRNHTCGITTANALRCWGTNWAGQTGDGTTASPHLAPSTIDAGVNYATLSIAEDTSCAITTTGILKCWGSNGNGQLGDHSTTNRSSPTVIDSGTTYTKVSTGGSYNFHTCAITTAGVLKCWGDNSSGQLGNGTTTSSNVPVVIDSGVAYKDVNVSFNHSCAITTGGVLKCWGDNGAGQLGLGNTTSQNVPTIVGSGY